MKLCVTCDSPIDEKTGMCKKCGRLAFKPQQASDFSDFDNVRPYQPGESESDLNSYERMTGRVSPIKIEPIKSKIPIVMIISNIVIVLGIILLLYIFYFS